MPQPQNRHEREPQQRNAPRAASNVRRRLGPLGRTLLTVGSIAAVAAAVLVGTGFVQAATNPETLKKMREGFGKLREDFNKTDAGKKLYEMNQQAGKKLQEFNKTVQNSQLGKTAQQNLRAFQESPAGKRAQEIYKNSQEQLQTTRTNLTGTGQRFFRALERSRNAAPQVAPSANKFQPRAGREEVQAPTPTPRYPGLPKGTNLAPDQITGGTNQVVQGPPRIEVRKPVTPSTEISGGTTQIHQGLNN